MKFYAALIAICSATAILAGCSDNSTTPPANNEGSTYKKIQTEIFAKSCAVSGCHAGSTPTGNMSLEESVALANLVNTTPFNDSAKAHGLKRVRPGQPDSSLLYLKVAGMLKAGYGLRMPLGSSPLSDGKIEFIRQWILAGAPTTGHVADTNLLSAATQPFTPLSAPAPGEGIQIHLNPFDIAAHNEREIFYFTRTPNTSLVFVNKFQVKMRDNSHHFVLYTYPANSSTVPPLNTYRDQGNDMEQFAVARNFYLGSQVADFTYQFPAGVALPLQGGVGLDLNSHYVNATDKQIQGEVYVNLYTIAKPSRIAKDIFWVKQDFNLLPFATTVVRDTQSYSGDVDIFMLTSHMHKHGQKFKIFVVGGANDGEMIYESNDWHSPVVKTFDTPFRLNRGQALRLEATYYNPTEFPITFGLTSEDEMCIALGYFAVA